jgi:hypothetical protein
MESTNNLPERTGAVDSVLPTTEITTNKYPMPYVVSQEKEQYFVEQIDKMYDAKLFPNKVSDKKKALLTLMKGAEIGFTVFESFEFIDVIENRTTLNGAGMLAKLARAGVKWRLLKDGAPTGDGDVITTIQFFDPSFVINGQIVPQEFSYTWKEAKTAGYDTKDTWKKMPKIMMRWRCVAGACRIYFSHLLHGMYMTDEWDNSGKIYFDEDGYTQTL